MPAKKRPDAASGRGGAPFENLRELLACAAEDAGYDVAFRFREGGALDSVTYAAFFQDVKALGSALVKEGLFGAHIAVWSKDNRSALTPLLTILATPGAAMPLPGDAGAEEVMEMLRAGDAGALFLDLALYRAHKGLLARAAGVRRLVVFGLPEGTEGEGGRVLSYDALLAEGRALLAGETAAPETVRFLTAPLGQDEPRLLLFPAGESFALRGIMFTDRNFRAGLLGVDAMLPPQSCGLSILPYHLPEELVCGLLLSVYRRAALCISASPADVMEDFKIFKPDCVLLSSLFVERLAASIKKTMEKRGKAEVFDRLLRMGKRLRRTGVDRRRAAFRAIHAAFGGRLDRILCVGAPLPMDSADFFDAVGITLFSGYSVPECLPLAAMEKGGAQGCEGHGGVRAGTLLPGLCAVISDGAGPGDAPEKPDGAALRFFKKLPFFSAARPGEILLAGESIAMGLYNDPAGSRALFPEPGHLRTGEFGRLDHRSHLIVTGRRRNLLSFKNGKTVCPEELEGLLAQIPYIEDAVVFAAGQELSGVELRLCAEIVLRDSTVRHLSREERLSLIQREIEALNATLPPYKRLRRVRIRKTAEGVSPPADAGQSEGGSAEGDIAP